MGWRRLTSKEWYHLSKTRAVTGDILLDEICCGLSNKQKIGYPTVKQNSKGCI